MALNLSINVPDGIGAIQVADEPNSPDGQPNSADAPKAEPKQYSIEEVMAENKKLQVERDKAKEKARKYEEAEAKAKEEKMKEEGKTAELLAQREAELADARKKVEAFEAQQAALRESYLSDVPEDMKEVAEDIKDIDKLKKFVSKLTEQKVQPYNGNGKPKPKDDGPKEPKSMKEAMDLARSMGQL